jgi:hypothetical protein
MSDNKSKVGSPDRDRIDTHEDHEGETLVEKFGVSAEELKAVVAKVGPMAQAGEAHLKGAART